MSYFSRQQLLSGNPNTDYLIAALNEMDESDFVCDIVSPSNSVNKIKGSIPIAGYTDKVKDRTPRQDEEPAKMTLKQGIAQLPYECEALDEKVALRVRDITPNGSGVDNVDPEMLKELAIMSLSRLITLKRELNLKDKITNTSNYNSGFYQTVSAGNKFNAADSTPLTSIVTNAKAAQQKSRTKMDSILIPSLVYDALVQNADTKSYRADIVPGPPSLEELISIFKRAGFHSLKKVVIADATYDSNVKTSAQNGAYIWGNDTIIYKQATSLQKGTYNIGAFISPTSADPIDFGIREFFEDNNHKVKFIEALYSEDNMIIENEGVNYAFLMKSCI